MAEHVDRTNSFPTDVDLWRELGAFGLLGITAPPEYGGLGAGYSEHCIAMEARLSVCVVSVGAVCFIRHAFLVMHAFHI